MRRDTKLTSRPAGMARLALRVLAFKTQGGLGRARLIGGGRGGPVTLHGEQAGVADRLASDEGRLLERPHRAYAEPGPDLAWLVHPEAMLVSGCQRRQTDELLQSGGRIPRTAIVGGLAGHDNR